MCVCLFVVFFHPALNVTHTIHVWYINLHLVEFYGKSRDKNHTWMLWGSLIQKDSRFHHDVTFRPTALRIIAPLGFNFTEACMPPWGKPNRPIRLSGEHWFAGEKERLTVKGVENQIGQNVHELWLCMVE